jgi:hypothetical protein
MGHNGKMEGGKERLGWEEKIHIFNKENSNT